VEINRPRRRAHGEIDVFLPAIKRERLVKAQRAHMGHAQRHVAAIERLSRDDRGIEQGLRGNHRLGLGHAIATMANAVATDCR
jgi:hypothetical protein